MNRGRGIRGRGNQAHSGRGANTGRRQQYKSEATKIQKSPVDGVDMLYPTVGSRKTNLLKVKKQFTETQQSEFGLDADFLSNQDVDTEEDDIPEVCWGEEDLDNDIGDFKKHRIQKKMDEMLKARIRRKENRYKIYARAKSICSVESKQKIESWAGYAEAELNKKEIRGARDLWSIIVSSHLVGDINQGHDDEEILFEIQQEYNNISRGQDHISQYLERFNTQILTMQQMDMEMPNEAQMAKQFLKGLGPEYQQWQRMYKTMNSPPLLTLADAYAAASKVAPRTRHVSRMFKQSSATRGKASERMAFATSASVSKEEDTVLDPNQCLVCLEFGHRAGNKCPLVQAARALKNGDGYLVMKTGNESKKPSSNETVSTEKATVQNNYANRGRKQFSSSRGRGRGRGRHINGGKFAAATHEFQDEDDDYYYQEDGSLYDEEEYDEYNEDEKSEGSAFVNIAFITSKGQQMLKDTDILLDAQSNINVFWNRNLLSNIVEADEPLRYGGQTGGVVTLTHYGTFFGIPKVWLDVSGKANLLCYKSCQNWLIDNKMGDIVEVRKHGFTVGWDMCIGEDTLEFRSKMDGLHTCDVQNYIKNLAAVNLVSENKKSYSVRDVKKAEEVTNLLKNFNSIDEEKLKTMLNGSMISGCELVGRDVNTRMDIEGSKFLPSLKGKSRQKKSSHVPFNPPEGRITLKAMLHCDIMHWRGRNYLIAVVNPEDYTMARRMKKITAESIRQVITSYIKTLQSRHIDICEIRSDPARQFLSGLSNIAGVRFNPKDSGAHEPVVENRIKTIKERLRANDFINKPVVTGSRLIDYQVYYVTQRYNMELSNNRSDKGIPWVAVTGCKLNYKTDFNLAFLDYVQATDRNAIKDRKPERTIGAIALYRIANDAGSWLFYSLATKRTFMSNTWIKLPMPDVVFDILQKMDSLSKNSNIDMDISEETEIPDEKTQIEESVKEFNPFSVAGEENMNKSSASDTANQNIIQQNIQIPDKQKKISAMKAVAHHPAFGGVLRRSERIRAKAGSYATSFQNSFTNIAMAFANIAMADGLRERPDEAIAAIKKELGGLHNMSQPDNPFHVWKPKLLSDMTISERKNIVPSSMFLKDKEQNLKARIVVNEVESRVKNKSELDTSSPGVDFNAVLIATTLRIMNKTTVRRVFDVGQAYTKAKAKRIVHVRLNKKVSKILCEMLPIYKNFVNSDGTIIVQLLQALYGTVDAGKLWYDEISGYLKFIGFNKNPYQLCVFNRKESDGSVTTICLFVDDGKMICDNDDIADDILKHLERKYGKLKIQTGNKFEFLGCTWHYKEDNIVEITQPKHINKIFKEYPVSKISRTPASRDLFEINEDSPLLSEKERELFHSVVYQLLFITQRTRPDFMLAINFLSGRCYCATMQDKQKLMRVVQYLNGTKNLGLELSMNKEGLPELSMYVDASLGIHRDGKSHTGSIITLGTGSLESSSSKQKINTMAAQESEVVGLSDKVKKLLWSRNFIKYQGISIGPAIVYQDNKGVLAVCKRGQNGNSRTKHIALRYHFIRDLVERGEIILKYCPTKMMVADMLTKPLQGQLFIDLRDRLLGRKVMKGF